MPSCVDEGVSQIQEPILRWLREIYNDRASSSLSALALRLAQRIVPSERSTPSNKGKWDQGTCLLITYADSVIEDKSYSPIASLGRFCDAYLDDVVSVIHILPFFPSSGDDGFAVSDHECVDKALGDWEDIFSLSKNYQVMADLVLNLSLIHI